MDTKASPGFIPSTRLRNLTPRGTIEGAASSLVASVPVLEWRAAPGEKEGMHSHPAMVVYVLSGSKIRFSTPDGKSDERQSAPGTVIWSEPITHAAENLGPGDAHSILIELKGKTAKK